MRRRARRLRRSREVLLLELGALVFEAERRARREPTLVDAKVDRLRRVDEEAAALAAALAEDRPLAELVSQGVAGPCAACGELLDTEARFCASCGTPTTAGARRAPGPDGGPPAESETGSNGTGSARPNAGAARTDGREPGEATPYPTQDPAETVAASPSGASRDRS